MACCCRRAASRSAQNSTTTWPGPMPRPGRTSGRCNTSVRPSKKASPSARSCCRIQNLPPCANCLSLRSCSRWSRVFFRVGLLACLLVCLTNCTRPNGLSPRLAVLRFENLSGDPALDWMGRGFSEIISGELEGSPQRYVIQWRALHSLDAALGKRPAAAPGISAERTEALAAGADEILYGDFSVVRGLLRATVTQEDTVRRKTVRVISATGPLGDGIFPVAGALARQLGQ